MKKHIKMKFLFLTPDRILRNQFLIDRVKTCFKKKKFIYEINYLILDVQLDQFKYVINARVDKFIWAYFAANLNTNQCILDHPFFFRNYQRVKIKPLKLTSSLIKRAKKREKVKEKGF